MLSRFVNIFKKKPETQMLGRWARNNDVTKAIYANSDHCGDIICGDPKKVKTIINKQKKVNISVPVSNNFHTETQNNEFCCMLLGIDGPCKECTLLKSPQVNMA